MGNRGIFKKGHKGYKAWLGKKMTEEMKQKMRIAKLGKKISEEHKIKISKSLTGRLVTKETRNKISIAQKAEKGNNWKGDNVSYRGLHKWIVDTYGKANHCEVCGRIDCKIFDWHNKNSQYKRNIEDWQMVCRKCHMIIDGRLNKIRRIK